MVRRTNKTATFAPLPALRQGQYNEPAGSTRALAAVLAIAGMVCVAVVANLSLAPPHAMRDGDFKNRSMRVEKIDTQSIFG